MGLSVSAVVSWRRAWRPVLPTPTPPRSRPPFGDVTCVCGVSAVFAQRFYLFPSPLFVAATGAMKSPFTAWRTFARRMRKKRDKVAIAFRRSAQRAARKVRNGCGLDHCTRCQWWSDRSHRSEQLSAFVQTLPLQRLDEALSILQMEAGESEDASQNDSECDTH